jgi:hypothetical protein
MNIFIIIILPICIPCFNTNKCNILIVFVYYGLGFKSHVKCEVNMPC